MTIGDLADREATLAKPASLPDLTLNEHELTGTCRHSSLQKSFVGSAARAGIIA